MNNLQQLLQTADGASPPPILAKFNPEQLQSRVRGRVVRRRWRVASSVSAAVVVVAFVARGFGTKTSELPIAHRSPATPTPDSSPSTGQKPIALDLIKTTREPDPYDIESAASETAAIHARVTLAAWRQIQQKEKLAAQRAELAELEAAETERLATDWQQEWARSGALRLELAKQDAARDPHSTRERLEQLAISYRGTHTATEATQILATMRPL